MPPGYFACMGISGKMNQEFKAARWVQGQPGLCGLVFQKQSKQKMPLATFSPVILGSGYQPRYLLNP